VSRQGSDRVCPGTLDDLCGRGTLDLLCGRGAQAVRSQGSGRVSRQSSGKGGGVLYILQALSEREGEKKKGYKPLPLLNLRCKLCIERKKVAERKRKEQ
jgi:hypothetical protein